MVPAAASNPGYCLVEGEIASVYAEAQNIRFSLAMPSHWNGKTTHIGGGGFDGSVVSPVDIDSISVIVALPLPLARGYVVYGSDSGHESADGFDASFTLNAEQLRNFAGEQLKKTHDAVIFLVKSFYGAAPIHSYFIGASGGGREALAVIQRYPEDYDGVVAMFPATGFVTRGFKLQLIRRDMRLHNGAGWIGKAKADFLRKVALNACDKLDGLEDSIISNVDACRIDFKELRCPDGRDSEAQCFSDAQLKTLQDIYSPNKLPYTLIGGRTELPAFAIGADWGSAVADNNSAGSSPALIDRVGVFHLADSFVRYFVLRAPQADALAFDPLNPGTALPQVQEAAKLFEQTSVEVDKFIARGGKWILLHGQSDDIIPTAETVEYYQRLVAKYGPAKTATFLRFYLLPGYAHGRGFSFNGNGGPTLDALEDWVERGIVPGTLTIVDANPEGHGRSRPMCVYPAWPKYKGVGDASLASSFSCALPSWY